MKSVAGILHAADIILDVIGAGFFVLLFITGAALILALQSLRRR